METILIVDDEKNYLVVLEALLGPEGYEIITVDKSSEALRLLREADLDLIITDMKMPGMSGMELLEACSNINPELPVIMITAYGTIEKALEKYRLIKQNRLMSEALSDRFKFRNIVGKSKPMLKIYDIVDKVSRSKASVLITGPSGTGKELIAKAIHYGGPGKDRPFISVNCGALTETLLESELFGHEKGAFTGAVAMRKGRFELADEGTLFLDEIGDMPPSLQVKLLRVLQETEFERVGGVRTIKVNVRVISASNRNIKEQVAEGTFREDLYYRLNVINIEVPPLKERLDDIPLLVKHFIEKYKNNEGISEIELAPEVWKLLYNYSWPGNVRQLENVIERAVVLNSDGVISLDDLPEELTETEADFDVDRFIPPNVPLQIAMERIEERLIMRALAQCNNVQSHAAKTLGITKSLIQHKMRKHNIFIKE
jgi:two-component system NtrC family response regulator